MTIVLVVIVGASPFPVGFALFGSDAKVNTKLIIGDFAVSDKLQIP